MTEFQSDQSASQARQVDAIYQQAMDLYFQHPDQAAQLLEQASILAQTGAFTNQPYKAGLTASLAALVRLNIENRSDLAARYSLQILSLLDGCPVTPPLIEAKTSMGWIYLHLGDYSSAMEWAHQALHHSREQTLPDMEATALDLIANIHGMLNEFPQALEAHEAALKIARAIQKPHREASILNNLAMTQMMMGEYDSALATSQQCLRMFQALGAVLAIANCFDTLAQIYLGMGDFKQAETNLLNGLNMIESMESQVLKTYLNKNLGRVYLAQDDLSKAIAQVEQALAIAQPHGLRSELADCHFLLASIYERQANHVSALRHFKQYHEISKQITGDTAAKRLALLNVIHSVENAKQEAEIYRLRNIELQSEIDERKRVQAALEDLATRDQLTTLYNRRCFLEKSEQEFERTVRYQRSMAVIMMDLDFFKRVNDTYGHAVGDQVLALVGKRLKDLTRSVDIIGRMGGEEFALVLPETNLSGASLVAVRLSKAFSDEPLLTSCHSIHVTASIGLTCFSPADPNGPHVFDTLLQQADEALYVAKNAGRNQVQIFAP